jgi:RNA polymerase sigma-70 factor (ECF subfamily)
MAEESDQSLITRCRNGDRQALDQLVLKYQRPLFNVAYRISGNVDDAADIVQSAFMKAFEKLDNYDSNQKFFSWIYRITINEALNAGRRQKTEVAEDVADPAAPGPEEALASADQAATLHRGLMLLDENYRAVVVLRHFSELSYREISDILDLSEQTVKSRIYTARQQLAAILQADR